MIAVAEYEIPAHLRLADQHVGIMLPDETDALGGLFTDNDALRTFQQHAKQGADARRPGPDDEHRILLTDLRDAGGPETRGQHVAHEQSLFVAHGIGDAAESLIGIGNADILRLPAVDAAAQGPTAIRIGAVVHISVPAEETFAAKGLDVDRDTVAGPDRGDIRPDLLHDADHFVADGDARHGAGNAAVLDVQMLPSVTRTMASRGSSSSGFGFSRNSKRPHSI